mgnify:CR=1 FL=1
MRLHLMPQVIHLQLFLPEVQEWGAKPQEWGMKIGPHLLEIEEWEATMCQKNPTAMGMTMSAVAMLEWTIARMTDGVDSSTRRSALSNWA